MLSNKKLNRIITELFIRRRKLNISLGFITKSYFAVPVLFLNQIIIPVLERIYYKKYKN